MDKFDKIEIPENPWEQIHRCETPDQLNTRRVHYLYPHDFYWTKNYNSAVGLRMKSDSRLEILENPPKISGLEIIKQNDADGGSFLDLLLVEKNYLDLFRTICIDLLNTLFELEQSDYDAIANTIINRLRRWQEMMAKTKDRILNIEAQLGLYGELLILRDFFLKKMSPRSAFRAWIGPTHSAQDFKHSNVLLEIKTQLSIDPVKISSLEQLNSEDNELFLIHQLLEESDDEGLSLQELVNRIRKEYASKDVVSNEMFKTSLLEANFNDNDQYNNRLWNLESRKGYCVNGEFPKLTRKNVNNLITSAIYKIDLESCSEFNSKLTEIHNKLSGDPNDND
jgi:hypothetical protein